MGNLAIGPLEADDHLRVVCPCGGPWLAARISVEKLEHEEKMGQPVASPWPVPGLGRGGGDNSELRRV